MDIQPRQLNQLAELLALSNDHDHWLRRVLDAERRGFDRGVASMADEYEHGFADGIASYKNAQHDLHRLVQVELVRWDGWREDFGRPQPGDYHGGPVPWDVRKAGAA